MSVLILIFVCIGDGSEGGDSWVLVVVLMIDRDNGVYFVLVSAVIALLRAVSDVRRDTNHKTLINKSFQEYQHHQQIHHLIHGKCFDSGMESDYPHMACLLIKRPASSVPLMTDGAREPCFNRGLRHVIGIHRLLFNATISQ